MVYIIVKKTTREREADLAESRTRSTHRGIEGVVRTTEEAHDMARERARLGLDGGGYYAVSNDSPEAKQARAEEMLRAGVNPETNQSLHTDSTRHQVNHANDVIGMKDGKPVYLKDV